MSDPSRQRLIRAVRLLPGTAKIGMASAFPSENIELSEEGTRVVTSPVPSSLPDPKDLTILQLNERIAQIEGHLNTALAAEAKLREEQDGLRKAVAAERDELYAKNKEEQKQALLAAEKEGKQRGYDMGYAEGLETAEKTVRTDYSDRFSSLVALLEGVHHGLEESREKLFQASGLQLITLWEVMLERMLLTRVKLDPAVVDRTVRGIVQRVSDREKIMVYLHPEDLPLVTQTKDDLLDVLRGIKHFEFLGDEHVDRGSCLVETGMGIYDARWRTQLEQISTQIRQLLEEGGGMRDATDHSGADSAE